MLSKHAARCLRAAGWFPGRKIDTGPSIALLEENEFRVSQAAREFLKEFGDLDVKGLRRETISWPEWVLRWAIQWWIPKKSGFTTGVLDLSAGRQLAVFGIDRLQELLCEPCLIGTCEDGHADLLITAAGELFGARMGDLWPLGRNPVEGINRLCAGTAAGPTISIERESVVHWDGAALS